MCTRSANSHFSLLLLFVFAVLLQACDSSNYSPLHRSSLHWSAIHVSGTAKSGDAHLLELPDGRNVLIDTGYPEFSESDLLPYLRERGIKKLDAVLVTHAHRNHYGALPHLAKEIEIDTIFVNQPDPKLCFAEAKNNRCNAQNLQDALASVPNAKIKSARTGDVIIKGDKLELRVVHQAANLQSLQLRHFKTKGKRYTVNESSVVSRLEYGNISILFPGDIGPTTGAFLSADRPKVLSSTLLAAPHHGVNPAPGPDFFSAVNPKLIIASIGAAVFDSPRGNDLRAIAKEQDRPVIVTGHSGHVRFSITPTTYQLVQPKN